MNMAEMKNSFWATSAIVPPRVTGGFENLWRWTGVLSLEEGGAGGRPYVHSLVRMRSSRDESPSPNIGASGTEWHVRGCDGLNANRYRATGMAVAVLIILFDFVGAKSQKLYTTRPNPGITLSSPRPLRVPRSTSFSLAWPRSGSAAR